MKKIFLLTIVFGIVLSGVAFAADGYVVQSVTGKVEREVSPGKWEPVKTGATLTGATVINTGLNSNVVLQGGAKPVTIKAMQKGAIDSLVAAGSSGGVRIGGKISSGSTEVNSRGTSNISTASTRASDAAADIVWAEE